MFYSIDDLKRDITKLLGDKKLFDVTLYGGTYRIIVSDEAGTEQSKGMVVINTSDGSYYSFLHVLGLHEEYLECTGKGNTRAENPMVPDVDRLSVLLSVEDEKLAFKPRLSKHLNTNNTHVSDTVKKDTIIKMVVNGTDLSLYDYETVKKITKMFIDKYANDEDLGVASGDYSLSFNEKIKLYNLYNSEV